MQKILMLPLDERPCNLVFPTMMCAGCEDILPILPPRALLGDKKTPANFNALLDWVNANLAQCDAAVLSLDMLVYGGIVPSRLHHLSKAECLERLQSVRVLKQSVSKIYAFSLIMRAPAYNSSDEEPDYYAQFGRSLYELGALMDREARKSLNQEEQGQLQALKASIPQEVVSDFTQRREVNNCINAEALTLAAEGVIDFLVVPLDDCAQYGWAAREQRGLRNRVVSEKLSHRVFLYSGADEVGGVLLARAANELRERTPAVYLRYSAVNGPFVVPKYEDRPLGENLKWQIAAAGGRTCASPDEADFVLMVNAPTIGGEAMGEANLEPSQLDASYASERCLPEFVIDLREMCKKKPVALADVALANGADNELMAMLSAQSLLGGLTSYAGWNTSANAAGTCIAHMMLCLRSANQTQDFLCLRLLEDWGYMANVRAKAFLRLRSQGHENGELAGCEENLAQYVQNELQGYAKQLDDFSKAEVCRVNFPWHRLFEIGMELR
ncbi:MAG: DUF4127 family protein [Clostridia bacterium]